MANRRTSGYDLEYLKKLAKAGAEATLHRLREEIGIIERTFPELAGSKSRGKLVAGVRKRAGKMSAAGRKAVSARMKKYWAERRKAAK
ncbi:MAG TPA: hypothetical protein VI485_09115 [Vicinamibacterales bacterium]|nr:hypothetical protein [Vicinamibacterales bacterium]